MLKKKRLEIIKRTIGNNIRAVIFTIDQHKSFLRVSVRDSFKPIPLNQLNQIWSIAEEKKIQRIHYFLCSFPLALKSLHLKLRV